ncbi:MAG: hypothetical protein N2C12_17320, partial [Planctomycetales bacterium]
NEMVNDPQAVELLQALDKYFLVYKKLDPRQHGELWNRPVDQRIEYLRRLLSEHQFQRSNDDNDFVMEWFQNVAFMNQDIILSFGINLNEIFERIPEHEQGEFLMRKLWERWQVQGSPRNPDFDESEYNEMRSQLSQEYTRQLDRQGSPTDEVMAILRNLPAPYRGRLESHEHDDFGAQEIEEEDEQFHHPRPRGAFARRVISRKLLSKYAKTLPQEEQEHLKNLPDDAMFKQLRERFLDQHGHRDLPPGSIPKLNRRPPANEPKGSRNREP